ncbi:unnamed protein product, partial [Amoebophrya sp. A120]
LAARPTSQRVTFEDIDSEAVTDQQLTEPEVITFVDNGVDNDDTLLKTKKQFFSWIRRQDPGLPGYQSPGADPGFENIGKEEWLTTLHLQFGLEWIEKKDLDNLKKVLTGGPQVQNTDTCKDALHYKDFDDDFCISSSGYKDKLPRCPIACEMTV